MNTKTLTIGSGRKGKAPVQRRKSIKYEMESVVPLLLGESENAYATLEAGVVAALQPVGMVEQELVARVIGAMWRLRRANRMEERLCYLNGLMYSDRAGRLLMSEKNTVEEKLRHKTVTEQRRLTFENRPETLGQGILMDATDRSFGLLRRYESRMERSLYAALAQLERLQYKRGAKNSEPLALPSSEVVVITDENIGDYDDDRD
jgi:hypothetical protein